MNRYRAPGTGLSSSRATPSTLCQKCLQRGHYSYECKSAAQERPYVSRPSRTQQLFNPKLKPKLTETALDDPAKKKAPDVEQLPRAEPDRGRKRDRLEDAPRDAADTKRRRSISTASSNSISSISTTKSRSISPDDRGHNERAARDHGRRSDSASKRRRASTSSVDSYSSVDDRSDMRDTVPKNRSTRRKYSNRSPDIRGRQGDRSRSHERRRRQSSNGSVSRDRIARGRRSFQAADAVDDEMAVDKRRSRSFSGSSMDSARSSRSNGRAQEQVSRSEHTEGREGNHKSRPLQRRERSLSPYSRRLALTQAMNMS